MPTVIVDPGHGGKDSGADDILVEKDYNLLQSNYATKRLNELGISTVETRSTDITLDPPTRTSLVKNSGAKICLCFHNNAGGGDRAEVISSIFSSGRLGSIIGCYLKSAGQETVKTYTRAGSDGRDYYFMHRDTGNVETVIIESCFVDNVKDAQQLKDGWKNFSESVVRSTCEYLSVAYHPPVQSEPAPTPMPKVQAQEPERVQSISTTKLGDVHYNSLMKLYNTEPKIVNNPEYWTKILNGEPLNLQYLGYLIDRMAERI